MRRPARLLLVLLLPGVRGGGGEALVAACGDTWDDAACRRDHPLSD